ncbi:MAG TPA: efflux RND transporter permease subunit [Psychromonas hadalis]|nr:efflux RND transporter permease subunit [Psychromonas hadalis]
MIAFFLRHPTGANVLMIAILILGVFALPQLQKDTFPLTPTRDVEVRINTSGASPQDIVDEIYLSLEEELDSLNGIKEVTCEARENIAIANVEMSSSEEISNFTAEIQQKVNSIANFPERVEQISVSPVELTANVATISIHGDLSASHLYQYALTVKQRLKSDPAIAQVILKGFSSQEIEIRISECLSRQYGISINDLSRLVEQQSINLPAGLLASELTNANLRLEQKSHRSDQFKEIIIKSASDGTHLKLGDIAKIQQQFTLEEDKILFNGIRTAQLEISKNTQQDSLLVKKAIQRHLEHEQQIAPEGLALEITCDVTVNIKERLRILARNGLQGVVLVFLVMWAFFNIRFSFWVAMGLPVSFLGSLFVMHSLGYTINMMTTVGLIVAIGLLMDDSLVLAENIAAKVHKAKQQGTDVIEAAISATTLLAPIAVPVVLIIKDVSTRSK